MALIVFLWLEDFVDDWETHKNKIINILFNLGHQKTAIGLGKNPRQPK